MATQSNLLRWYKINIEIHKLKGSKPDNLFWMQWEKNKLMIKRLKP